MKVAILVDGGFYRKRAFALWGDKSAEARAKELWSYCLAHSKGKDLYRIFYYDCPPIAKQVYHPLLRKTINLKNNSTYNWTNTFFKELKKQRKLALRLGVLSDERAGYSLKMEAIKALFSGAKTISDITEADFAFTVEQKGVDMKLGLDIASLAYKKQVDQIILISGDSDFVPAAKLARREGIDFILDPLWANIKADLQEHIDGLQSQWKKKEKTE